MLYIIIELKFLKMSPMQQQAEHDMFDVLHCIFYKLQKQKDFHTIRANFSSNEVCFISVTVCGEVRNTI